VMITNLASRCGVFLCCKIPLAHLKKQSVRGSERKRNIRNPCLSKDREDESQTLKITQGKITI